MRRAETSIGRGETVRLVFLGQIVVVDGVEGRVYLAVGRSPDMARKFVGRNW
jgi:hypothetical protein